MTVDGKSTVSVKGDIIYVACIGHQDKWTVQSMVAQFLDCEEDIVARGQPPKCIVDMSQLGDYEADARTTAIEAIKDKAVPTAVIGTNPALQVIVNFMTKMAGQSDKFKLMKTVEEAEAWLHSL